MKIVMRGANGVAQTVVGAIVSTAIALGAEGVTNDERKARLAVCAGCDQLQGGRCGVCHCFVSRKAMLKGQTCPLKKW